MRPRHFSCDTALVVASPHGLLTGLRRVLLNEGFTRVIQARDGVEAIRILGMDVVGVVFTPWKQRGATCGDILSFLRRKGRHRRTPVVLLDNGLPKQTIVSAVKFGVTGVLPIPASTQSVRGLLGTLAADRKDFAMDGGHEF